MGTSENMIFVPIKYWLIAKQDEIVIC